MARSVVTKMKQLPTTRSMLAVCAHPDDESFGLGAALASFDDEGSATSVLCFTHGEASTLGADTPELGRVRAGELSAAALELGVNSVALLDYSDGRLSDEPLDELKARVHHAVTTSGADLLLVFDEGGITGHADHCRASEAALAVARDLELPVLAWTLTQQVADTLNHEFGAGFVGCRDESLDFVVQVDRARQRRAISHHVSQNADNPVLARRLQLQGDEEAFRWLRAPQ